MAVSSFTSSPRVVQLGERTIAYPSTELQPLNDCTEAYKRKDYAALRASLAEDGYLYLKNVFKREDILSVRSLILSHFAALGGILSPTFDTSDGVLNPDCSLGCVPFLEGRNEITHNPKVLDVVAGPTLQELMCGVLDTPEVLSFDYKWLRAMPRKTFTGAHMDSVYMSRGTSKLHTVWIPFDDATLELGALALCQGSHRLPGFEKLQKTYGELDVERDKLSGTGWFTTDPLEISKYDPGCQWRSTDFSAGDIVIFGMRLMHASTANLTDRVRISCDVRWQPASEPVDVRYMRPEEKRKLAGAWSPDSGGKVAEAEPSITIDMLKRTWGFITS